MTKLNDGELEILVGAADMMSQIGDDSGPDGDGDDDQDRGRIKTAGPTGSGPGDGAGSDSDPSELPL